MRIATFITDGTRKVGVVSGDGLSIQPLDPVVCRAGRRGHLEHHRNSGRRRWRCLHRSGPKSRWPDVSLDAPLPKPRRNLWCVGRNYHAHAKEGSASVFKDNSARTDEWPIVFTKVPECVVRPARRRAGSRRGLDPDRLRGRTRRRYRQGRQEHHARGSDGPCLRLHGGQRRDGARRSDPPRAMGPWQVLRHLLPDGTVDRDGATSSTAPGRVCAAGSTESCVRTAPRRT